MLLLLLLCCVSARTHSICVVVSLAQFMSSLLWSQLISVFEGLFKVTSLTQLSTDQFRCIAAFPLLVGLYVRSTEILERACDGF